MICGHCETEGVDIPHVRQCSIALPYATVTEVDGVASVDKVGENFFLTNKQINIYNQHQADLAEEQSYQPVQRKRTDLQVFYIEKDEAKAHGARWDAAAKAWYVEGEVPAGLQRFVPAPREAVHDAPKEGFKQDIDLVGTVDEGFYRMDGAVYKVQWNQSETAKYSKILVITYDDGEDKKPRGSWEYSPGAMSRLRQAHVLSLKEAKEFGSLYGVCCICGRRLTNEESIDAGIGPVCREKF